jgi:two-component system, chemotaxis family, protein-glutamate methylesterase/glutaminase
MNLRAVVADDSSVFRRAIAEVLTSCPGIEVVATVGNGKLAVQKVRDLRPDLLTLDLEMPEMDGLEVLETLRKAGDTVGVIVVSALTRRGGDLTMRALEKGAFDFIPKPDTGNPEDSREALRCELIPRVRTFAHRLEVRTILRGKNGSETPPPARRPAPTVPERAAPGASLDGVADRMKRLATAVKPEMVLIGVSTGGPAALAQLLPALPSDLGVPIAIVQHLPPIFTQSLAESLDAKCAIRVREGVHGERLVPNTAYIAPGGKQMRLAPGPLGKPILEVTDDPPENNCKPAADYLFRSASIHFPGRAMGVILTGMGSDGALGLRLMKRQGAIVVAQSELTCVVYGMPKAAVEAGVVDAVLPLDAIAGRITAMIKRSTA